ncbi:MAG: GH116 family glycosyl-hydrolase [Terracidiphilus sp.]
MTILDRRDFLKQAAGAAGAAAQASQWSVRSAAQPASGAQPRAREAHAEEKLEPASQDQGFPRSFEADQLHMISFPLGGVAAGSVGLGGRGQLRDWEIFNRPNQGYRPQYAFAAIWAQIGAGAPVARILESRILPPYEGPSGLGADNVPGMSRLESATFTGAYPLAQIRFHDSVLPVGVELEAFSPFIPHDPDESGLPVAILHYKVTNHGPESAKVSIAYSLENPILPGKPVPDGDKRRNQIRHSAALHGISMDNPAIPAADPMQGTIALAALDTPGASISCWCGWPQGKWWTPALLFWDRFSVHGDLGPQPNPHNGVGVVSIRKTIAPGQTASFRFLLGWHFANRTPDWCGWAAPKGHGDSIIGNYYATRFPDAWQAIEHAAANLPDLESRTRLFANAFAASTVTAEIKDAASANLSTLASTTCFRTADGEFHGFEGSGKTSGCCFGNCLHVWNYETVTPHLFPSFARSLRRSAFGYSMEDNGAMHFRQLLPDGIERSGNAAADGQMGQIIHAWLDWRLSGDTAWLRALWPRIRKAVEFAWIEGGWDSNRDGVLEGVQHNTYDVEFYGPNPMCSIYYLGALRAAAEMAEVAGDSDAARQYRSLYEKGRDWIDANLFNGEYYVQQIRGFRKSEIAPGLVGGMGAEDTEHPQFQVGEGCLIDQLVGQYLVDADGLVALVNPDHIRRTLASIYRYNAKPSMTQWENMARTYAVNDESAVVICDYARAERPRVPFPYFSESWTGLEYTLAALLIRWGMTAEGVTCVRNTRARFDGVRRNPWNEVEAGNHYVRAMASWSVLVAMSGFQYRGDIAEVTAAPPVAAANFNCFWASATGWGAYSLRKGGGRTRFTLHVLAGSLPCRVFQLAAPESKASATLAGKLLPSRAERINALLSVHLDQPLTLGAGQQLQIETGA